MKCLSLLEKKLKKLWVTKEIHFHTSCRVELGTFGSRCCSSELAGSPCDTVCCSRQSACQHSSLICFWTKPSCSQFSPLSHTCTHFLRKWLIGLINRSVNKKLFNLPAHQAWIYRLQKMFFFDLPWSMGGWGHLGWSDVSYNKKKKSKQALIP